MVTLHSVPVGFFRFIISSNVTDATFTMVARNSQQAWTKFRTQHFRNYPLKPARSDWSVKKQKGQA